MKMILKIAAGLLLVAVSTSAYAQNTTLKVVQDLRFKFTAYYQMTPTENATTYFRHAAKVTISNNDIINLFEKELNIIFSTDAKFLLMSDTPVDPSPRVIIRDTYQGEKFDTDVTDFFSAQVLASIENTKINKNPLKANGSSYDAFAFELNLTDVNFRVQGLSVTKVGTGKYEGDPTALVHTGKVNVTGSGNYRVSVLDTPVPVALEGTVQISGSDVKAMTD